MRTDYRGLEAFVAIAELGSFSKAAASLSLSQTALSHRIRKLEEDLGVKLLVRSTRDVALTKDGQDLLPLVQRTLVDLSQAYSGLQKRGKARLRRVAFACLPTIANTYLPKVLHRFAQIEPDIAIQVQDQPYGRIYEMVQAGDVEFGVTIVGARHWDLDIHEIATEPYMLLAHKDHPLARKRRVKRSDLSGQTFVRINTQSSNRQLVDDALGPSRDTILWRYTVQNAHMALSLVAEGAALTVLPATTASLSPRDVVAVAFEDSTICRTLGIVTRRGIQLSRPAEKLLAMITEDLAKI